VTAAILILTNGFLDMLDGCVTNDLQPGFPPPAHAARSYPHGGTVERRGKPERMRFVLFVFPALLAVASGAAAQKSNSVIVRAAPRVEFPGVVHQDMDPQKPGEVDCSSPAHWDEGRMYMFYSAGHPFRSAGPDLFHLSRPSKRPTHDSTPRTRNLQQKEQWTAAPLVTPAKAGAQ
jgi:hypothetical protein